MMRSYHDNSHFQVPQHDCGQGGSCVSSNETGPGTYLTLFDSSTDIKIESDYLGQPGLSISASNLPRPLCSKAPG